VFNILFDFPCNKFKTKHLNIIVYICNHMSIKVNNIDLRILNLFTKSYNIEYYIREIERALEVSSRTSLVTLAKLEKIGILKSQTRGKIKLYSINKSKLSKSFFVLTENYKKIQFINKYPVISEIIEKTDEFTNGIVLIFGSYAKELQNNNSDLDLFIVGKYNTEKIKEIGKKYQIEINVKSYPKKIFYKELHSDILLKEIMKNHIIIKGVEQFVNRAIKWTQ
jgi:uncharacterized protein